ncbi:UNVERIFIED_CONTAM: hypothetical protein ABID98_004391 [Brevibacillus sp. OAP136]
MDINDDYKLISNEVFEQIAASEEDPVDFWEQKQRELITSVVDYNLNTLADLVSSKDIDISPKYQRRFRWDEERQSKLIESFLMNVPVPPVFLNEDSYGQYSVIDGKQRLTAITDFFKGKLTLKGLKVFSDINGLTFEELPKKLQTVMKTRPTIRAIIILRQSDEDVKFEVFQRLNTGGVSLNAQEIRNSTYPGQLNDLILDLSENKYFHKLLNIRVKKSSAIFQEMRDAELVLRYFTFKDNWAEFKGGMKRQMDHYMASNQHITSVQLVQMREEFLNTLEAVHVCFEDHSFQRWIPEKKEWKKQVLASLYDAQMFALRGRKANLLKEYRNEIVSGFQDLFENNDFRSSIDAATNTPSYFKARITMVSDLVDNIIGGRD